MASPPIPYPFNWLLAFAAALALAAVLRWRRRPWRVACGWALASVPVWLTLWGIVNSLGPLVAGTVVLEPLTRRELSNISSYKVLRDVGFVGAGALLATCPPRPRSLADVARGLRLAGLPMGRGEWPSVRTGLVTFPLLLAGAYLLAVAMSRSQGLNQGDESSYYANMTPYHAVLLSAAAAFGEEVLYRGFLQPALRRGFGGGAWAAAGAVVVQGVVFAFAHAGYGTWSHVLSPLAFGVLTGFAAHRYGLWCPIVLHFLIDVYAFSPDAFDTSPWLPAALGVLLAANLIGMVAYATYRTLVRMRAWSQPAP